MVGSNAWTAERLDYYGLLRITDYGLRLGGGQLAASRVTQHGRLPATHACCRTKRELRLRVRTEEIRISIADRSCTSDYALRSLSDCFPPRSLLGHVPVRDTCYSRWTRRSTEYRDDVVGSMFSESPRQLRSCWSFITRFSWLLHSSENEKMDRAMGPMRITE